MMYESTITAFIIIFILSVVGTMALDIVFRFLGKRGYLGNLFPNVRGGIPRAVGLVHLSYSLQFPYVLSYH